MRQRLPLADVPGGPDFVVLCPSARHAAALRRAHGALQAARGVFVAPPLHGATPAQWLDHLVSAALLRGEVPPAAAPALVLSRAQERCLWEQAIAADDAASGALFDVAGLAQAAMDAERIRVLWRIDVPDAFAGEEYQAFLRWRARVEAECRRLGAATAVDTLLWRIECVARGVRGLPARVGVCGFVSADATLERLLRVLAARGVDIVDIEPAGVAASDARAVACDDAEGEIAAAAAWAARHLAARPQARLCIGVADLPRHRASIELALDRALHPLAIGAAQAQMPRDYAFADGQPLAGMPTVDTAIALLAIAVRPQRVPLGQWGRLLCGPGWSADVGEADARAQFDAWLRQHLVGEPGVQRMRKALARSPQAGHLPELAAALAALGEFAAATARRLPSDWGAAFPVLLTQLGWPGERPAGTLEREQAVAFADECATLATLDGVLGRIHAATALRLLQQACRERRSESRSATARLFVCDIEDVPPEPLDGLWVMGLNESAWPPPARSPALLPAAIVRAAGVPDARGDLLADAASRLLARWRAVACESRLSWARREDERELAPSPLLAALPTDDAPAIGMPLAMAPRESLLDDRAPPMTDDEIAALRGGTALLAAQASCPAWAFHRHRLGALALAQPSAGLDARARGGILHAALEAFWRGRGHAALRAMSPAARAAALDAAIAEALQAHAHHAAEPVSRRLMALEARRLARLLDRWLDIEAAREAFDVVACEERRTVKLGGLSIDVIVDRVDALADGSLAIIDYKSGRTRAAAVWAQPRLLEPQLPIYAAIAYADRAVTAVALARVHVESPGFAGVAADDGLLPGVRSLTAQRRAFREADFPDWAALRRTWAERLAAIACEVREGLAGVVVADEKALAYCEVLPLLRLAERRRQFDATRGGSA